jgi:hypothetical protein
MHHVNRTVELDMKQGIDRRITNQIGASSVTAVSSVWAALGTVFLAKETAAPVSAGPGVDI